jgi:uncharacterized protein with PQ loop repeat
MGGGLNKGFSVEKEEKEEKEEDHELNATVSTLDKEAIEIISQEKEKEKEILEKSLKDKARYEIIFQVFGYLATALSIFVWLPVIIDIYTNPASACNLNSWVYIISLLSNVLWVIYSAGILAWPLLASSVVVVILLVVILVQKFLNANLCDQQHQIPNQTQSEEDQKKNS